MLSRCLSRVATVRTATAGPRLLPLSRAASTLPEAGGTFGLTEDAQQLKDSAKAYFMETLNPLLRHMDDTDEFPEEAWKEVAEAGWMGLTIPERYEGAGLDFVSAGVVTEAINYANCNFGISHAASDNLCTNNIYLNGTEAQREKYLPALCNGDMIGALGMSEPGAGSDAIGSMATRAEKKGDVYVLNGSKMWITNGPVADVVLVYAKTDPEAGSQGVSAFILESGMPGFTVGAKNDKMGFRGSPQSALHFEDVEVPAENLLGRENAGVAVMMSGLDLERTWVAAAAIGAAERALDLSVDWARQRVQFGKPIGSFQMVQDKLATMYTSLEGARGLVYRALAACNAVEAGQAGRGEVHKLSAAAFMAAAQAGSLCCDEGVQIFGGTGFMRDTEINALYRTTKAGEIAGGSMEIRKLIIAGELLKGR